MNRVASSLCHQILASVVYHVGIFYCSLGVAPGVIDGDANVAHMRSPVICTIKVPVRFFKLEDTMFSEKCKGSSRDFCHFVPGFGPVTNTIRTVAYAAPAVNISIVLALVRPDNVAIKRIVAIVMTAIRVAVLAKAVQMTTGTSKR